MAQLNKWDHVGLRGMINDAADVLVDSKLKKRQLQIFLDPPNNWVALSMID